MNTIGYCTVSIATINAILKGIFPSQISISTESLHRIDEIKRFARYASELGCLTVSLDAENTKFLFQLKLLTEGTSKSGEAPQGSKEALSRLEADIEKAKAEAAERRQHNEELAKREFGRILHSELMRRSTFRFSDRQPI